jgi:hypothetical protein
VRFLDRSTNTRTFKRGIDACTNPSFYRQIGKDPAEIVHGALDLLAKRFNLYESCRQTDGRGRISTRGPNFLPADAA